VPQRIPARIDLKPAQETALAWLRQNGSTELTRGLYQTVTGMSRSQAAYDIAELVEAGILVRVGGGRSTRYRLTGAAEAKPAQRRWTSERIRHELERFCAGRKTWPTAREFKRAGRMDLYVAASRYGGVRSWAGELGLSREAAAAPRPLLRRWPWAASGAATGAVLAGLAIAILHPWANGGAKVPAVRIVRVKTPVAAPAARAPARTQRRKQTTRTMRAHAAARAPAPRASATAARVTQPRTVSATVANSPARAPIAVARTQFLHRAKASSSGAPAPLAAPLASSSPPAPLPAP
jgi:hypothetical protein